MSKTLSVTIPDAVSDQIDKLMVKFKKTNKSEFVSELLRKGIYCTKLEML